MRAAAVALTLLLAAPVGGAPLPEEALIEEGQKRLQAGDLKSALQAFAGAEKLAPKDPRPRYLRGAALAQGKDLAGATKAFREALAIDPKLAEVHNELGAVLLEQRQWEPAAAACRAAVTVDAKLYDAWFNLALAERERKRYDEAISAFTRAAALQPSPTLTVAIAALHRQKGDPAAAEAVLRPAITANPRSAALQLELARTLAAAKKCTEARLVLSTLPMDKPAVQGTAKAVAASCPAGAR